MMYYEDIGVWKNWCFFFGNFDSALLVKKKVLEVESEIYSYLNETDVSDNIPK